MGKEELVNRVVDKIGGKERFSLFAVIECGKMSSSIKAYCEVSNDDDNDDLELEEYI